MDWDGDGLLDIIVGDREGSVSYFRRLPIGDVLLTEEPPVKVAGRPISLPFNSAPSVIDWNGDDLPDLVVGRADGVPAAAYLFVNQGSPGEPLFTATDTVMAGGQPIQLYYVYPDFHDMNGDGLQDLVFGCSQGRIACCINSGTTTQIVLEDTVFLQSEGEDINLYTYVRPSVCDWNGDGIPDILAADYTGFVYLFLGEPDTWIGGTEALVTREGSALAILGNPVSGQVGFRLTLPETMLLEASLYSVDGRLLLTADLGQVPEGETVHSLAVSALPRGPAIIRIQSPYALIGASGLTLN